MPIRTRRWDDPRLPDDGLRILVTPYPPRGVRKADETWDLWMPQLGPSKQLHAASYSKRGRPMNWFTYRSLYLSEMARQIPAIRELAERVARGETITLLCSSACIRESTCHRSLLKELIESEVARGQSPAANAQIVEARG